MNIVTASTATKSTADEPTPNQPTAEEPTHPTEISSQAENSISLQLCSRAYENIMEKDEELVDGYEAVVSEQAPVQGFSGTVFAPGGLAGALKEQARFGLLLSSAQRSIAKATKQEDAKTVVIDAVTFFNAIGGAVGPIAGAFPPAGLAWAGICAVLPVCWKPHTL